jgi:heterogeneous nuclear ribonucleoprotein G
MAQKLFVGGIAFSTTEDGLREFFTPYGTVVSANVITDKFTGQSRGFGFVEMETAEAATKAAGQLNGRMLDGRTVKVEVAQPKTNGGGRDSVGSRGRGSWR